MFKEAFNIRQLSVAQVVTHLQTPLYRNAYALMLSNGLTSVLGFVYWVVAARLYTEAQVGIGFAIIASMTFLSGMSQLNMIGVLTRFIPTAGQATLRLVGIAYLSSIVTTAVTATIFVLGLSIWGDENFVFASSWFLVWFVLANIGYSIFAIQDGVLTGLRRTIWVPIENALFAVAKIIFLFAFAEAMLGIDNGIFASWAIPIVLAIIPVNILLFWRLIPHHMETTRDQAQPIQVRQLFSFITGDYLGSLLGRAAIAAFPLMIISTLGEESNGYFGIAWQIAFTLQLVSISMTTSLTVESAVDEQQFGEYGRRSLAHLARILAPLVLVIVVGAPFILQIFGENYAAQGVNTLRFLALAALPYAVISLYVSYCRVRKRTSRIVFVSGSLFLLSVSASYLLLPAFGIVGVGMAWFASQVLIAAVLIATELRPILRPNARDRVRVTE
ncbi:MAG: hypothetical protein GFH27_549379n31 [Chloroflexi bacterium AL-W]|nr:hypothetical protein [Chloroflexi bacterium AL-N1]NOK71155.1 hypothetical protein [Chloroflexi bacterium AL-N10]NOK78621.1 hypothetical protein [Chloroflexi bacterium AL-N5]NOK85917.1 hypothetical protein [Chloroflexi bacterium AL-W]NOK92892.1 hypothetical protein [Chloroflexi bacterium AL-N15]